MAIPKNRRKPTYGQKRAQQEIGQRERFQFAGAADRHRDEDKPDWMIARDEAKGMRGPAKPKPKPRPVKQDVIQTFYYRGAAGIETELDLQQRDKFKIPSVDKENAKAMATSLIAVKVDKEPSVSTHIGAGADENPVWEIMRITGFKAANEGIKSAESLVAVRAPRAFIEFALQKWSQRYGHTEVASNMASPMVGAAIIHKVAGRSGRHHRM